MSASDFVSARHNMVEQQIVHRNIRSAAVIKAMRHVPREQFVPRYLRKSAYDDGPLPISSGQTISQPYIVALMLEALNLSTRDINRQSDFASRVDPNDQTFGDNNSNEHCLTVSEEEFGIDTENGPRRISNRVSDRQRVLEIGTGSGYAAAVLAEIAQSVYTIERIRDLARQARTTLHRLGYSNVRVGYGDGSLGWFSKAPFDAIVVTAGGPKIPTALKRQLKIGGRMVIPVGVKRNVQSLIRITRVDEDNYQTEELADVRFVSLIGSEGWEK